MKLIAGLGNPGREYEGTPHNVGFDAVALIASRLGAGWRDEPKFSGRVAKASAPSCGQLVLVQPLTFMNLSGDCVGKLMRYYRIEPRDVIAISDDADLPVGRLRVRAGGGNGGHRGLLSLIGALGTESFPRVRIGIGRGPGGSGKGAGLRDFVLSRLSASDSELVGETVSAAADAALAVAGEGVDAAMNKFNGFCAGPECGAAEGGGQDGNEA